MPDATAQPPSSSPHPGPPQGPHPGPHAAATAAADRLPGALRRFHPGSVPPMARANYAKELLAAICFPFALVVFEGSVLSVLVRLIYEGRVDDRLLNYASAFIAVVPALANVSSFAWVRLSHARDKIRAITILNSTMLALVVLLAFMPRNTAGLIAIAAIAIVARTCWAGFTTLRSTVWKQNYPDNARARITGRFGQVGPTLLAVLSLSLGAAMNAAERLDQHLANIALAFASFTSPLPDLSTLVFRVFVPVGAVIATVALVSWRRIRVRERRALSRAEAASDRASAPSFNPVRLIAVLRKDRAYDRFMTAQLLLGLGNIMSMSLLAIVLREVFSVTYFAGLLVSTAITLLVMPLSIPFWARLFDRTHILEFRAIHSWIFVVALSILLVATRLELFWLMVVFAILKGVAFGGGMLGWTLGHLDFAPKDQVTQYMGVHVTLTGLRGIIAWAFGVTLYEGLERLQTGAGTWIFTVCILMTLIGALMFVSQARHLRKRARVERTGDAPGSGPGEPPGA
ncbi:MAG: hypothetical protein AAF356_11495 [Planctomycetota bacterium]